MNKYVLLPLFGILIAASLLWNPQEAFARSLFEDSATSVPAGQTVDDLYVIGENAEIHGHVTGGVVVVGGNLHLASTAQVDGVVIVIGGRVTQDQGAVTSEDFYIIRMDTVIQNSLLIGGGMVALQWFVQLAGSLVLMLIPLLFFVFGGRKARAWVKRQTISSWRNPLYLGVLSGAVLMAFSLLCMVTLVGIPFILIVILFVLVAFIMGMTLLSYQIGGLIQEQWISNDWVRLVIGASLIVACMNIPLIGWLVSLLVIILSLGTFTHWMYLFRKKNKNAARVSGNS